MYAKFCDIYSPSKEKQSGDNVNINAENKSWFFYGYLYRTAEELKEDVFKDWTIKEVMRMLIDDLKRGEE